MMRKILFLLLTITTTTLFAQVTTVYNPITERTWMDRNLGALQVATSFDDADAFGDLYQWGRETDGHQIRTSTTTSVLSATNSPGHSDFILANSDWLTVSEDNLWQGVNGINNPCPQGFRIPTEIELDAERLSWTTNDAIKDHAVSGIGIKCIRTFVCCGSRNAHNLITRKIF